MRFDVCKETFAYTGFAFICMYTLRQRERETETEREKERVDIYEI